MSYLSPDAILTRAQPVVRDLLGGALARVVTLAGGASLRRYHRLELEGAGIASLVLMETGDPQHSDEATSATGVTELPFVNVQRFLERGGVSVPKIYQYDAEGGLLYMEDLGDITFES